MVDEPGSYGVGSGSLSREGSHYLSLLVLYVTEQDSGSLEIVN